MHAVITGYWLTDDIYCRLTDIGASKSENKGGPEQSECLCAIGFVGGWCTKKTNQAKVNWETSCVSSWELKSIPPCFLGPFILVFCIPLQLHLICSVLPTCLIWSLQQCINLTCDFSVNKLPPALIYCQGYNLYSFLMCHFIPIASKQRFQSSLSNISIDLEGNLKPTVLISSLFWMSYLKICCTWVADFIIRMIIM